MQKQTLTLDGLRQKVVARKENYSDEVVSIKTLLMDEKQPGMMIVRRPDGSKEAAYAMDSRVYSQASGVLYGLPGSYLEKLVTSDHADPELAARNFNHWVKENKEKEALLRLRKGKNDAMSIRALLPGTWNDIPYEDSLNTLISKFGPDQVTELTQFDDDAVVAEIITRELDRPLPTGGHSLIKDSDPFKWGLRYRDSDCGVGKCEVAPFTVRMICTNGMVAHVKGASIVISHTDKASRTSGVVQAHLRQCVEMIDTFSEIVALRLELSKTVMLDVDPDSGFPEDALQKLIKTHTVTKLQDKYIREAWDVERETIPEPTVYRLLNAITRAGTHASELDLPKRIQLQNIAGAVLEYASVKDHRWN